MIRLLGLCVWYAIDILTYGEAVLKSYMVLPQPEVQTVASNLPQTITQTPCWKNFQDNHAVLPPAPPMPCSDASLVYAGNVCSMCRNSITRNTAFKYPKTFCLRTPMMQRCSMVVRLLGLYWHRRKCHDWWRRTCCRRRHIHLVHIVSGVTASSSITLAWLSITAALHRIVMLRVIRSAVSESRVTATFPTR